MGNLGYAYILNMLRAWAGDEAGIIECGMQFRAIIQNERGAGLHRQDRQDHGKAVVDGRHVVTLETNVVNQNGLGAAWALRR